MKKAIKISLALMAIMSLCSCSSKENTFSTFKNPGLKTDQTTFVQKVDQTAKSFYENNFISKRVASDYYPMTEFAYDTSITIKRYQEHHEVTKDGVSVDEFVYSEETAYADIEKQMLTYELKQKEFGIAHSKNHIDEHPLTNHYLKVACKLEGGNATIYMTGDPDLVEVEIKTIYNQTTLYTLLSSSQFQNFGIQSLFSFSYIYKLDTREYYLNDSIMTMMGTLIGGSVTIQVESSAHSAHMLREALYKTETISRIERFEVNVESFKTVI